MFLAVSPYRRCSYCWALLLKWILFLNSYLFFRFFASPSLRMYCGGCRQFFSPLLAQPHSRTPLIILTPNARTLARNRPLIPPPPAAASVVDQLEVFELQMALASKLSRPVSVHCVKAHGKLVAYLRRGRGVCDKRGRGERGSSGERFGGGGDGGGAAGQVELTPRDRGEGGGWRLPPRIALQ